MSGQTHFLVVGAEPGASKIGKAKEKGLPMIDVRGIKVTLETPGAVLDAHTPQAVITSYSKGFKLGGQYNGLAIQQGLPVNPEKVTDKPAKVKKGPKPKKEPKAKKQPKPKKRKQRDSDEEDEEEDEEEEDEEEDEPFFAGDEEEQQPNAADQALSVSITCDLCGTTCTLASWLVGGELDVCLDCYDPEEHTAAVLCEDGEPSEQQPVPKAKSKAKGAKKAKR